MALREASAEQVRQWIKDGRAVYGYPRKGIIVVDGFKRFTARPSAIQLAITAARENLARRT